MIKPTIIGVDFDGTVVTHAYPDIGSDIGALPVLRELVNLGHKLVLFTMRSSQTLEDAVNFLQFNGVYLHGVNVNPEQHTWTSSPKAYCQLYIDDAALGCPLTLNPKFPRVHVDWDHVQEMLIQQNILLEEETKALRETLPDDWRKDPNPGMRFFPCDGCAHNFWEYSRDWESPSISCCPKCNEVIFPKFSRKLWSKFRNGKGV